jgi:hypothetical protein
METEEEKAIRAVEKVLKEPFSAGFSDQVWKIRANLIVASTIGVVMGVGGLRIDENSTFLGLKFLGLNDSVIRTTLTLTIMYLLLHFIWAAWDGFMEWRLRLTGTRKGFVTGAFFEPEHVDSPVDPRQSTLYNWWAMQAAAVGHVGEQTAALIATSQRWETELKTLKDTAPDWSNMGNVIHSLAENREVAAKLMHAVETNNKTLADPRIITSLRRFDRWYLRALQSQNSRWLLIEFAAPVLFAAYAVYALQR